MKQAKIILALIFLILPICTKAQFKPVWSISINSGYGYYAMTDLKMVNDFTRSKLPFSVKNVNDFKPDLYYGMSLHFAFLKRMSIGLIYQYFTTGSRIGQKDYSGYYAFDQIINGHFIGFEPGLAFGKKSFVLSPSFCAGVLLSKLKMDEKFIVGETENQDSQNELAHSMVIMPAVKISEKIFGPLSCFLSVGNMVDIGGRLHLPGNKKAIMVVDGSGINSDWSGWRLTFGLNVKIFNKNSTPAEFRGSDYFER